MMFRCCYLNDSGWLLPARWECDGLCVLKPRLTVQLQDIKGM